MLGIEARPQLVVDDYSRGLSTLTEVFWIQADAGRPYTSFSCLFREICELACRESSCQLLLECTGEKAC